LRPRAFPAELDELEGIEGIEAPILGFAGSMILPRIVVGSDLLTNFLKAKGARLSLLRITLPPTPSERVYKSDKEAGKEAGEDILEVEELLISTYYADSFERPRGDPSKE
jgi:hypothetical protein